jgi:hypothetical protein
MYGYQVTFEHPSGRRRRSVLQILSRTHYRSVIALLRAEGLYDEYRHWNLVDFRVACSEEPEAGLVRRTDALPAPGTVLSLVA